MPRGVPASGKRRTGTAVPAEPQTVFEPTGDAESGIDVPADVEEEALVFDVVTSVPSEGELTPEQAEIQRLRDELARVHGKKDVEVEYEPEAGSVTPDDGEVIRIHVLEDGMTAQGRLYYRGDEIEFVVGSGAHKDTFDRNGRSWLDLRHDEFMQVEKYGRIMFRNGPWPGKTYLDGTFENLRLEKGDGLINAPSADELAAAEKARKRRAAPRLPSRI